MEVLIKTSAVSSDNSSYQDGDIVDAFSLSRIRLTAAGRLFDPKRFGFDTSGLRFDDSLQAVVEAFSKYKFERVAVDSVQRTNLVDNTIEILDFNNLDEYLKRRTENSAHTVFGSTGAEVFYTKEKETLNHETVWDVVESVSDYNRANFSTWEFSELEKVYFLPLNMTGKQITETGTFDVELSDGTVDERRSPLTEIVGVDDDGEAIVTQIAKRKYRVPYWDLTESLKLDLDNIRSTTRFTDGRIFDDVPHIDAVCFEKDI